MSTLYIEEYSNVAAVGTVIGPHKITGQAPSEPSIASQTVSIAASSTQSNAFQASTLLIRVHADSICSIAIGANPTAVTTQKRMAANQTEYFGVQSGHKLAVIQNT